MNEMQKKLDKVYVMLSAISVNGDNVEIMAQAKAILREVFSEAKTEKKENTNG